MSDKSWFKLILASVCQANGIPEIIYELLLLFLSSEPAIKYNNLTDTELFQLDFFLYFLLIKNSKTVL